MKCIAFSDIGQFREVVATVNRRANFVGLDENDEPVYDPSLPKPVIRFRGTVKLHGTNAGVSYIAHEGIWAQSRGSVITPEKDNAGFAFFVETKKDVFKDLIQQVVVGNSIDTLQSTVTLYGEWAGPGVHGGSGISGLKEKSLFLFGAKVSRPGDEAFASFWVDYENLRAPGHRIYNVADYGVYELDIDFARPELAQRPLSEITERVEAECPVAKTLLGITGIGEGVVWTASWKDLSLRFKVKGEKHSVTKVKTLAKVDVEKITSIREFVDYAVTPQRFDQAVEAVFGSRETADVKRLGDLIRWMINDISKEETDTLAENGLEPKEVNKYVAEKTRQLFFALPV